MNIWEICNGINYIKPVSAEAWRVVEAQHILSSRDLVDSIAEHDLLEEMVEASKPDIEKLRSYLIFTPFRYPPLKYGSRFGQTFEPSLWYGSFKLETAFAETAYYRRMFLKDTEADLGYIDFMITAFNTVLTSKLGIDLTKEPFDAYSALISAKDNYQYSQTLGSSMRHSGVETFIYYSARTEEKSQNVAAYTPNVFGKIQTQQTWQCIANSSTVEFTRIDAVRKQRVIC
jgi:hypothetical protein